MGADVTHNKATRYKANHGGYLSRYSTERRHGAGTGLQRERKMVIEMWKD